MYFSFLSLADNYTLMSYESRWVLEERAKVIKLVFLGLLTRANVLMNIVYECKQNIRHHMFWFDADADDNDSLARRMSQVTNTSILTFGDHTSHATHTILLKK